MEVVLDGSQQLLGSVHQEASVANDCKHMCLRRRIRSSEAETQALFPNVGAGLLEPIKLFFVQKKFRSKEISKVCRPMSASSPKH